MENIQCCLKNEFTYQIKNSIVKFLLYFNNLIKDNLTQIVIGNIEKIKENLIIGNGKYTINFNNTSIDIIYTIYNEIKSLNFETTKHEELFIIIHSITKDKSNLVFEELCKEVIKHDEKFNINEYNKIKIYNGSYWKHKTIFKRHFDTIYLDNSVTEDIKEFYESKDLYRKFGIPYKRVYLFYGPPGTGKTSIINAIASEYSKNLAYINFNSKLNSNDFTEALDNLHIDDILVLEDFDRLSKEDKCIGNSEVDLPTLLNVLDGSFIRDGSIIIITANSIDKFDKALLRHGRIDYKLEFKYISESQIQNMIEKLLPNQINLIKDFINKIKYLYMDKMTTSVLQKFLFDNRNCENIIKEIPKLAELIKKDDSMTEIARNMYS